MLREQEPELLRQVIETIAGGRGRERWCFVDRHDMNADTAALKRGCNTRDHFAVRTNAGELARARLGIGRDGGEVYGGLRQRKTLEFGQGPRHAEADALVEVDQAVDHGRWCIAASG